MTKKLIHSGAPVRNRCHVSQNLTHARGLVTNNAIIVQVVYWKESPFVWLSKSFVSPTISQ